MFGKCVLLGSVVAASLLAASSAANGMWQCPVGVPDPGSGQPNNSGIACVWVEDTPAPYPPQTSPAPRPRPKRPVSSYIAVAWHPLAGDVWATWNHWSPGNAEAAAVNACKQVMGGEGCQMVVNGWDTSVAVARDETNILWLSWGDDPKQARNNVLKDCEEKKKNCKIVHVFSTESLKNRANNRALDFSKNYFPDRAAVSQAPPPPYAKFEYNVNGHQVVTNQQLSNILIAAQERKQGIEKQFANDPRYALMKAGYWELMPRSTGLATGDGCAATFATLSGAVAVAGPKGEYRNAAITFFGGNIPIPKDGRMTKVTLEQTGGKPPATVEAYHFPMVDGKLGAITFVVPDASALVNNMFDEHRFAVSLGQKPAIEITWRGGHGIRDRLTKCLKGSGNPY
jgi:Domain of unknown function (DUF4189)